MSDTQTQCRGEAGHTRGGEAVGATISEEGARYVKSLNAKVAAITPPIVLCFNGS